MRTLQDAWDWYAATLLAQKHLRRLAIHWGNFPVDSSDGWILKLQRDPELGQADSEELVKTAISVGKDLNNLAVLVFFSVFEANIRDLVYSQVQSECIHLEHPTLKHAGQLALEGIETGSFFRVLEAFKVSHGADVVEQVNQVRRWRNWVAHGERSETKPSAEILPREAFNRLSKFLDLIRGIDYSQPIT